MSNHFPIWILLSVLACSTGCQFHHAPAAYWPMTPYGNCEAPPADNLVVRAAYIPPESPPLTSGDVNDVTPRRMHAEHLALTPEECQCQAASASTTAKLIDVEYRLTSCAAMQENSRDECVIHKTRTQLDILAMRAARERNQAAGEAMKFYYQLASAHAAQDGVAESLRLTDQSLSDLRALRVGQIPVEKSEEELLAQRSKLLAKQAELDKNIAQLSGLVVTLTGRGRHEHPPVWPVVPMDLTYEPVDVEAAVAMGLQQRRDLAITRCMLRSLNSNSLPNARAVLKGADFGVGNPVSPSLSGLCRRKEDYSLEICMRRRQLQIVLADQTRAAAEEIRASALAYEAAMRDAVLNGQRYSLLKQRLQDVQQLRAAGQATPLQVTEAELQIVESRGQFAVKIIEAHSAEARLRQAMEMMADECGHAPKLLGACWQCSPCADKTEARRGLRSSSNGNLSEVNRTDKTMVVGSGVQPIKHPPESVDVEPLILEEQTVEVAPQTATPSLAEYVPVAPAVGQQLLELARFDAPWLHKPYTEKVRAAENRNAIRRVSSAPPANNEATQNDVNDAGYFAPRNSIPAELPTNQGADEPAEALRKLPSQASPGSEQPATFDSRKTVRHVFQPGRIPRLKR